MKFSDFVTIYRKVGDLYAEKSEYAPYFLRFLKQNRINLQRNHPNKKLKKLWVPKVIAKLFFGLFCTETYCNYFEVPTRIPEKHSINKK